MRRVVGLILAGLGAFFLVLAGLLRFYAGDQVLKFPTNEYQVATLHDSNASYFSVAKLRELNGVSVTATDTLRGDVLASNSGTAVWDEFTVVHDDNNNVNFDYTQLHAGFNRRTGLLLNCCGASLNGHSVHLSGQGFVWPIGSRKTTYQIFDDTLQRAEPIAYAGTQTLDGLSTYRYVEQVTPQQSGTQSLPGSLVGIKDQPTVTLPEYYQATITYWVDPVTGGPVKVEQNVTRTLRDSTGATRLLLVKADLVFTPQSVRSFVDNDVSGKNKITLITFTLPLILLIAGLVLLAAGAALAVLGQPDRGEHVRGDDFEPQDQGLAQY